jgi:hypothetical protein
MYGYVWEKTVHTGFDISAVSSIHGVLECVPWVGDLLRSERSIDGVNSCLDKILLITCTHVSKMTVAKSSTAL